MTRHWSLARGTGSADPRAYRTFDRLLAPTKFRRHGRLLCTPDPDPNAPSAITWLGSSPRSIPRAVPAGWVVTGRVMARRSVIAAGIVRQVPGLHSRDPRMTGLATATDDLLATLAANQVPTLVKDWAWSTPHHCEFAWGYGLDLVLERLSDPHASTPMVIGPRLTHFLQGGQADVHDVDLENEIQEAWQSVPRGRRGSVKNIVRRELAQHEVEVLIDAAHGVAGAHDMQTFDPETATCAQLTRVNNYRSHLRARFPELANPWR